MKDVPLPRSVARRVLERVRELKTVQVIVGRPGYVWMVGGGLVGCTREISGR